ncbi:unnamed protein product [Amoebophrya sp. A120]|nr:unnamed protein product [Amoebophrya sp. A120]|eukprot:GSA120T00023461001.1
MAGTTEVLLSLLETIRRCAESIACPDLEQHPSRDPFFDEQHDGSRLSFVITDREELLGLSDLRHQLIEGCLDLMSQRKKLQDRLTQYRQTVLTPQTPAPQIQLLGGVTSNGQKLPRETVSAIASLLALSTDVPPNLYVKSLQSALEWLVEGTKEDGSIVPPGSSTTTSRGGTGTVTSPSSAAAKVKNASKTTTPKMMEDEMTDAVWEKVTTVGELVRVLTLQGQSWLSVRAISKAIVEALLPFAERLLYRWVMTHLLRVVCENSPILDPIGIPDEDTAEDKAEQLLGRAGDSTQSGGYEAVAANAVDLFLGDEDDRGRRESQNDNLLQGESEEEDGLDLGAGATRTTATVATSSVAMTTTGGHAASTNLQTRSRDVSPTFSSVQTPQTQANN